MYFLDIASYGKSADDLLALRHTNGEVIRMDSLWKKSIAPRHFATLEGDAKTDVLIVGGGMAGLLCAYQLVRAGVACMLVEADRICNGVTADTTAKLTVQHGLIYDKLLRRHGIGAARAYWRAQNEALCAYRTIANEVECDFEEKDSYVYSLDNIRAIEREVAALKWVGAQAEFLTHTPLPFSVAGALRVPGQAQFHPLKFAFGIAKDLPIFEQTKVLEFIPGGVRTNRGTVRAKRIIVATHFPILNKHGGYFLKMYQHRSYVLALENAPDVRGMYVDESKTGLSFRNHAGLLLLGGGGHRTGKKGGNWRELEGIAAKYFPEAREVARWATQDCITLDGLPYIGRYAAHTKGLFVATGFNKWGMTSSMVAATLLCDLVRGRKNEYEALFSPSRSFWRPQLAANAAHSLLGLVTPTAPRCPHLGCALKYNRAEHTWDCPCHGSRFTEKGELINGPATDDKRI